MRKNKFGSKSRQLSAAKAPRGGQFQGQGNATSRNPGPFIRLMLHIQDGVLGLL
jgi:hypothetical protein